MDVLPHPDPRQEALSSSTTGALGATVSSSTLPFCLKNPLLYSKLTHSF